MQSRLSRIKTLSTPPSPPTDAACNVAPAAPCLVNRSFEGGCAKSGSVLWDATPERPAGLVLVLRCDAPGERALEHGDAVVRTSWRSGTEGMGGAELACVMRQLAASVAATEGGGRAPGCRTSEAAAQPSRGGRCRCRKCPAKRHGTFRDQSLAGRHGRAAAWSRRDYKSGNCMLQMKC